MDQGEIYMAYVSPHIRQHLSLIRQHKPHTRQHTQNIHQHM